MLMFSPEAQNTTIATLASMLRAMLAALARALVILVLGLLILLAALGNLLATAIGLFARQLAAILVTLKSWLVAFMPWLVRAFCVAGGLSLVILSFYLLIDAHSGYVVALTAIGIPVAVIFSFRISYATSLLAGAVAAGFTTLLTSFPLLTPFAVAIVRTLGVFILVLRRRATHE